MSRYLFALLARGQLSTISPRPSRLINYVRARKGSLQSKACLIAFSFSIEMVHSCMRRRWRQSEDLTLTCHL